MYKWASFNYLVFDFVLTSMVYMLYIVCSRSLLIYMTIQFDCVKGLGLWC